MNIYNEVTIDMNPESVTYGEHLSEDSCNYNGDLDLCLGGGGGGPPAPSPYYWAGAQPGKIAPTHLPSGYAMPPSTMGAPIPGVDPFFQSTPEVHEATYTSGGPYERDAEGELTDEGRKEKRKDEAIGSARAQREYEDRFKEGWYRPYFESMVAAPMRGFLGMPATAGSQPLQTSGIQGLISQVPKEFVPLSQTNIDPAVLQKFEETVDFGTYPRTAEAGYSEPIIAKGFSSDVQEAGDIYSQAEEAYETALERIAGERDVATDVRSQTLEDIRAERLLSTRGDVPGHEKARVPAALTGMAYSGPAQRAATGYEAKEIGEKLSYKEKELGAESEYESTMFELGEQEEDVETAFKGEQSDFAGQLSNIFQGTAEQAIDLASEGQKILSSHHQYGPTLSTKHETNIMGRPTDFGYIEGAGGGIWGEQSPYELGLLGGVSDEARRAAERLQTAAYEAITGIVPGGTTPV